MALMPMHKLERFTVEFVVGGGEGREEGMLYNIGANETWLGGLS